MKTNTESVRLSARIRRRKSYEKQCRKRHESMLAESLRSVADPDDFLIAVADEGGEGLLGGGTWATKSAIARALRRQEITRSADQQGATPVVTPRPTWTLRESHRPAVFPSLVDRVAAPPSLEPIRMILQELEARLKGGEQRFPVLDWLHSASARPWAWCAEILVQLGFPVDREWMERVAGARNFWHGWAEFQRRHAAAVRLQQIDEAAGEWAFVESPSLASWLCALHVPEAQRRDRYLIHLVQGSGLDFHSSPRYLPLFKVPLEV